MTTLPMDPLPRSVHATLAGVDIAAFGSRANDDVQLHLRRAMYGLLEEAFTLTRLPWGACYHEDRGDGALIVAPTATPAETFLDPLAHHLHAGIRRHNRLSSEIARLQLRMAVHTGRIHFDENGVAGRPSLHLFRMLNSAGFKKILNDTGVDLGVIVSERLYDDVIRYSGVGLVDPDAYQPVRIRCKETRAQAWVWLPPVRSQPPFEPAT